jgi:hypothetical protein
MTNANKVFFARLFPSTLNHIVIFPYQVRWLKLMQRYATLMPTRARRQMPQGIEKPNGCGPRTRRDAVYNKGTFYDEWQSAARLKGKCEFARFRTVPAFHPQPVAATGALPRPKYETCGGVIPDVARQSLASTLQA